MHHVESITLNSHLMTFIVGQKRLIDSVLRPIGINYTEFCVLFALLETSKPALTESLADYLILKPRTVLSALATLESKGLIFKQDAGEDNRKMLVSLASKGRAFTNETAEKVNAQNAKTLHDSLPAEDLRIVMLPRIKYAVDEFRGHSANAFLTHDPANPGLGVEHFIFWRVLLERWTEAVHQVAGLSLGEYRLLSLLLETNEMGQSAICRRLMMQKSKVSDYKTKLIKEKLIKENRGKVDARESLLCITAKGRRIARQCGDVLTKIWKDGHASLSDEEMLTVEAWYARMYGNLVKANTANNGAVKGTNF